MNVLSLFDGMSAGQIALEHTGINVTNYYASEIKETAITVTQHNYPDTIQVGDVTKLKGSDFRNVDLLIGGSPCFTEDALVLTKHNGHISIKDVSVNDEVLSHTGHWRKVLNVGGKTAQQLRKIKSQGNIGILTTDNHPFYACDVNRKWNNEKRNYERQLTQPKWVNAEDLTKHHVLGQTKIINLTDNTTHDEHFWYMIGRYIGDGWYRKTKRKYRKNSYMYQFIICCGYHEFEELNNHFIKFGYNFNYTKERTAYKFRICSKELVDYVEPFGQKAHNKIVPPQLFSESLNHQKAFLRGFLDADGCFIENKSIYSITSTSKRLVIGLQQIIKNVYNIHSNLYFYKRPKTCVIEGRTVNQRDTYLLKFQHKKKIQNNAFNEDLYSWYPVKANDIINKKSLVYNLEVEIDNSYTVNNFIVHNCQNLSQAMKSEHRDGLKGDKSSLFFEYHRLLTEVRPIYFLLENVGSMREEDKNIITSLLNVSPIQIKSEWFSPQLRNRYYWTNISVDMNIPDKNILLQDILESGYTDREKARALLVSDSRPLTTPVKMYHRYQKFNTLIFQNEEHYLTCKAHYDTNYKGKHAKDINNVPDIYDGVRYLSQIEMERLQTVPEGYTSVVSRNQAAGLLGDGWTVDVISHIFQELPNMVKANQPISQKTLV